MKKNQIISIAAVLLCGAAMTSCSPKMGKLSAENFNVVPTPMELQGTTVPITIYGAFPEKYMNKKAVVTVTPELRFGDNSIHGQSTTFQGEKVLGNDQQISYLLGGHYTMRDVFNYTDDMHNSQLYLTFDAFIGNKKVNIPPVKISYGILATSGLYKKALQQGGGVIAPDTFQYVRTRQQEASVRFLVNEYKIREHELKNNSIQEFTRLLDNIVKDYESYNLQDIEVLAYSSPEGGQKYNAQLSIKRQSAGEIYVDKELTKRNVSTHVTGDCTAQDWDGFQQLVMASNIQDKELILRVLNMYKDPQEREDQIKNMSKGFQDLAKKILPRLRRARMIINYESVGRSDEQLFEQWAKNPKKLSLEEVLYFATLQETIDKQEDIYRQCTKLYPEDYRAYNNIAAMEYGKGNNDLAKQYVQQALQKNPRAGEPYSNLSLIALQTGDIQQAEAYMARALGSANFNLVQGAVDFAKGNYKQAAYYYKWVNNNMSALTQIMALDYAQGRAVFKQIKEPDAMTNYLHAILCARESNKYAANGYLKDALKMDPSLEQYAHDDLEFANIR